MINIGSWYCPLGAMEVLSTACGLRSHWLIESKHWWVQDVDNPSYQSISKQPWQKIIDWIVIKYPFHLVWVPDCLLSRLGLDVYGSRSRQCMWQHQKYCPGTLRLDLGLDSWFGSQWVDHWIWAWLHSPQLPNTLHRFLKFDWVVTDPGGANIKIIWLWFDSITTSVAPLASPCREQYLLYVTCFAIYMQCCRKV